MTYHMVCEHGTGNHNDEVCDLSGLRIHIDSMSKQYLVGTKIDYNNGYVYSNPNTVHCH